MFTSIMEEAITAGFVNHGWGINPEGARRLEELGLKLIYVSAPRPGLQRVPRGSADSNMGEKPNCHEPKGSFGFWMPLGMTQVHFWQEDGHTWANCMVGSNGDPYYNYGTFIGPKEVYDKLVSA